MFASAFGSFNPQAALKQYHEVFEKPEEPKYEDYEEFVPEDEGDIQAMINVARRAGVIS